MIIAGFGSGTLPEYINSGEPQPPRPTCCPKCQARNSFWKHGHFFRLAVEGALEAKVRIQRFLCRFCGLAVSCLFTFLIPYRRATVALFTEAVETYGTSKTTYREVSESASPLESELPPRPSHGQVFRWVQSVCNKAESLLFHAQKELLLRGLADEVQGSVNAPCPNAHKAHTVSKARKLNRLAELLHMAGLLVGDYSLSKLQSYFLSHVESWQLFGCERAIRFSNPQNIQHVLF